MVLPIEIENTPQQIWGWVLSILQNEMSRTYFDNWVKPTRALSFENGTFILECPNNETCEWLQDRLKPTINRILEGYLNQNVQLRFVTLDMDYLEPLNPLGEDKNHVEEGIEKVIDLEPIYASLRDALIEPDRVVKMPVYFLRWLPYVGSRTIFEVVGFWQEYYLNGKGRQPKSGEKVTRRVEQVCRWCGTSRAQLFRDLQPGGLLEWFVHKVETDHELDHKTGRFKKSPNKYILYGIPLTPGDASDLVDYLVKNNLKQNPKKVLLDAVEVQPNQILHYPYRMPSGEFTQSTPHRITVQEVIRDVLGHKLDEELSELADKLAERLLSSNDFILIRWYFLQNWLPRIGHNAAMFLTLLRNMCYFNDETGEIRDEVWVEGGYSTIAARLGMENPRLVAQWLPPILDRGNHKIDHSQSTNDELVRRETIQAWLSLFVERLDFRQNGREVFTWHFKVQRGDPLLPEHEVVKHAAAKLFLAVENAGLLEEFYVFLDWLPNDCCETLKIDPIVVLRLSKISNDCIETLETIFKDCFDTLKTLPNACFETLLKTLKNYKDSLKEKNTSFRQDPMGLNNKSTNLGGMRIFQPENWKLEKILNRASQKNRDLLLAQEKSPIPLVSWILFGVANSKIENPLSLAISKLKEHPHLGAGGVFDRLATINPETFVAYLRQELINWSSPGGDWRVAFQNVNHDRLRMMVDLFDIQVEPGGGQSVEGI